jgi:hypothetical protein
MKESDISTFIKDSCTRRPEARVSLIRLWDAYLTWCQAKGKEACWPEQFMALLTEEDLECQTGYIVGLDLPPKSPP